MSDYPEGGIPLEPLPPPVANAGPDDTSGYPEGGIPLSFTPTPVEEIKPELATQDEKDEALRSVWKTTLGQEPTVDAEVTKIADTLKTSKSVILDNLPRFRSLAEEVGFDPADLRTRDPVLYSALFNHPELAVQVKGAVKEDLSAFRRVLRGMDANQQILNNLAQSRGFPNAAASRGYEGMAGAIGALVTGENPLATLPADKRPVEMTPEERQALRDKADEPKTIENAITDPLANEPPSAGRSIRIIGARIADDYRASVSSWKRAGVALAILGGASPETVRAKEEEALRARLDSEGPRYYGPEGALGSLSDAMQGVQSSVQTLAAGGAAGLATLTAATAATAAGMPRTGALIASAGPLISKLAGGSVSFRQELGGYLLEADTIRTDDGKPIDEPTKIATGVIYATIASIIETANELGEGSAAVEALGPLGKIVSGGAGKRTFTQVMLASPAGRAVVDLLVHRALGEAGEEGGQQTAQEMMEYAAKSITDGRLNTPDIASSLESIGSAAGGGFGAGLLLGAGSHVAGAVTGSIVHLASGVSKEKAKLEDSLASAPKLEAIRKIGASETAKNSPKLAAAIVVGESSQSGSAITAPHVDPTAIVAYFEGKGEDPATGIAALDGNEAALRFRDALAAGSKYEVPLDSYIGPWTESGLADAVKDDTAERADLYTPREMELEQTKIEERVAAILKEQELARGIEADPGIAPQLEESGQSPEDADTVAAMHQAFTETVGAKLGIDTTQLFTLKTGHAGVAPAVLPILRTEYGALDPTGQQRAGYTELATGLLNARGDTARGVVQDRPMRVRFSPPAMKVQNDEFGHEAGDSTLRTMAGVLAKTIPDGAQRGGDIEADVTDQAQADTIAAAMSQALDPEGRLHVVASTVARASSYEATAKPLGDAQKTAKAKAIAEGKIGERGKLPPKFASVAELAPVVQKLGKAKPVETAMTPEIQKAHADDGLGAFEAAYLEEHGLLNGRGYDGAIRFKQPGDKVLSGDIRSFFKINEAFGRQDTDAILSDFFEVMAENDVGAINGAHPSGDEIGAVGPEPKIRRFFEAFNAVAKRRVYYRVREDGTVAVQAGLTFAIGVGETKYEADTERLPEAKLEQDRAGAVAEPVIYPDIASADRELAALRASGHELVSTQELAEQRLSRGDGSARRRGSVEGVGTRTGPESRRESVRDASTERRGPELPGQGTGDVGREADRGAVQGASDRGGPAGGADRENVADEQAISAQIAAARAENARLRSALRDSSSPESTREATTVAKRLVPSAKFSSRAKSMRDAFETIMEPIGGADASPTEQADYATKRWLESEPAAAPKKQQTKETRRARQDWLDRKPPPSPDARVLDELNKEILNNLPAKKRAEFRGVTGLYEAFRMMLGGDLSWDSPKMAAAIAMIQRVDGLEHARLPEAVLERQAIQKYESDAADFYGDVDTSFDPQKLEQPAFHGTPYRGIEREGFKLNKIGTGEGAQAYGWGIYLASRKAVAEWYREKLTSSEHDYNEIKYVGFTHSDEQQKFVDRVVEDLQDAYDNASWLNVSKHLEDYQKEQAEWFADVKDSYENGTNYSGESEEIRRAKFETNERFYKFVQDLTPRHFDFEKHQKGKGQTYKVEVPEDDELLDYDATLDKQPPGVIEKLEAAGVMPNGKRITHLISQFLQAKDRSGPAFQAVIEEMKQHHATEKNFLPNGERFDGATRGRDIYRALSEARRSPQRASEALAAAGIPGLRYLDGGSRGDSAGTHNYVIWDESRMPITETLYQPRKRVAPAGTTDKTSTPKFKKWFKGSKVVDADGKPMRVFHGTTADFTTFDRERANPESDFGAGFYFTNTVEDVGANYAGIGPDLEQKIELEAERIAGETDRQYDDPEVVAEARAKFMQHGGATIPVYLALKNPIVVGGDDETRLTYTMAYDEETGAYLDEEPKGTLADFMAALRDLGDQYHDGSTDEVLQKLSEAGLDGDMAASQLIEIVSGDEQLGYYTDDTGKLVSKEMLRQALEAAGFDGVIDHTVNEKFGSDRKIGKSMAGMHEETVHYVAFKPEQVKSAIGNRGTFDAKDPNILHQPDAGDVKPRGSIEITRDGVQRAFKIFLTQYANDTTRLHELGHAYLEVLGDLAHTLVPDQRIVADWQAALKYLGAVDRKSLTVEQKEKWARAWEAYLMEGKAPSAKLVGTFQRMRLWLTSVYKHVKNLNVQLDDSIRGVFDRLLATDEEIARMRAAMGMQGENYSNAADDASARVYREIVEEQKRVTSTAWQAEIRKAKVIATAEFDARPAAQARRYMLDQKKKWNENTEQLDTYAEMFGYPSGQAMLESMRSLPDRDEAISARADDIARKASPEIRAEHERLEAMVVDALHSEGTVDALVKEWGILMRRAAARGVPDKKGLQAAAEATVARMPVRRINSVHVRDRELLMAQRTTQAAAKGDFKAAAEFKAKQILAHMQWIELEKVRRERQSLDDLTTKLSQKKYRERLGKAGPAYRDVVDSILESLGVVEPTVPEKPRMTPDALKAAMEENGQGVVFDPAWVADLIARPRTWRDFTVEEMRAVHTALVNIKKGATRRNTFLMDGKRHDRETFRQEGAADAAKYMPDLGPKVGEAAMTMLQHGLSWAASGDAMVLTSPTMIEWLGGEKTASIWHRAIVKPLREAAALEADLLKKHVKPVVEAMEAIPQEARKRWGEKIDGRALFPHHREDLLPARRFEVLLMIANRGTKSSIDRLTEGRGITLAQLDNAIVKLGFTRAELQWVQSIWDAAEAVWPLARDLEERDTGVVPDKLDLEPFIVQTADGPVHMRGGYFPAIYDKDITRAGARQSLDVIAGMMPLASRPSTSRGHLKGRVEGFADAIDLSPRGIQAGLIRTIHDIAFREPLQSVAGLITDDSVQDTLRRHLGIERREVFKQWLQDIGRLDAARADPHAPRFARMAQAFKTNLGISVLGHAVDNFIADTVGVLAAPVVTKLTVRNMAAGLAEVAHSPLEAREFALKSSAQVRLRDGKIQAEYSQKVTSLGKQQHPPARLWRWYRDHAFYIAEKVDAGVTTTIWTGAYRQAAREGKSHDQAVEFADQVIVEALPASSVVDRSALSRSKGLAGALSMFYGYYNLLYNQERRILHQIHTAEGATEKTKATLKALGQHLALIIVTRHLAGVIMGKGPEPEDGTEQPERWLNWFLRGLFVGSLDPLPFGIGRTVETKLLNRQSGSRPLPMNAFVEAVEKAFGKAMDAADETKETGWLDAVIAALRAAGMGSGTPMRPIRPIEYLLEATDENSGLEVRGPGDVVGGMFYSGAQKKPADNIPTLIQDAVSGRRR